MRPIFMGALACLTAGAFAQSPDGNWPQFRGPGARGLAEGAPPPTQWSAETGEGILWKRPLPGLSHASPVVWGDRIFITTAVGQDPDPQFRHGLYGNVAEASDDSPHRWMLLGIDKRTGEIEWERLLYEGTPRIHRHTKSTHDNATPATDGRNVVAFFGSHGLHCTTVEGEMKWSKDFGVLDAGHFRATAEQWGTGSSPVIHEGRVIIQVDVQGDSFLAALDVETGDELWRTPRDEWPSWGSPTVHVADGRAQIITNATNAVRGYDAADGALLWTLRGNGEITVPTPFVAHGLAFVASGYRPIQPIYAIRLGAVGDITLAERETTNEHVAWSARRGGSYMPTPIVVGDRLYICQNQGILACYDARTGERLYQERLAHMGSGFSASPVAGDGKIYLAGEDGVVFVIRAGATFEQLAANPMGEILMATPAISEGVLYIRGLKTLFAVGR
jgi:outer membrane protein assembly factor BamB